MQRPTLVQALFALWMALNPALSRGSAQVGKGKSDKSGGVNDHLKQISNKFGNQETTTALINWLAQKGSETKRHPLEMISVDPIRGRNGRIQFRVPNRSTTLLVKEGDQVAMGEPVAMLESLKMGISVLAPKDGVVSKIAKPEGSTISKGDIIIVLDALPSGDIPNPVAIPELTE